MIAPFLGDPPTRFDLVRGDPLDAIPGQAQLCAAEETLVSQIPDRPRAEAVLAPLHLSGSRVAQRSSGIPRRCCVFGFVKGCHPSQDQPSRSENDPAADLASLGPTLLHARSMNLRLGVIGTPHPHRGARGDTRLTRDVGAR